MCEIKDYIKSMESYFLMEVCAEFNYEDIECALCDYGNGKDLYMNGN